MALATAINPLARAAAIDEPETVSPTIVWRALTAAPESGSEPSEENTRPIGVDPPRMLPLAPPVERMGDQPQSVLQPLQKWEGVVLNVDGEMFTVRLVDLTGDRAEEEMQIEKDELSDFDLDLLQPGAIFYWIIGYRRHATGARERVSLIRFRRLPAWSQAQLNAARTRAEQLARELAW